MECGWNTGYGDLFFCREQLEPRITRMARMTNFARNTTRVTASPSQGAALSKAPTNSTREAPGIIPTPSAGQSNGCCAGVFHGRFGKRLLGGSRRSVARWEKPKRGTSLTLPRVPKLLWNGENKGSVQCAELTPITIFSLILTPFKSDPYFFLYFVPSCSCRKQESRTLFSSLG